MVNMEVSIISRDTIKPSSSSKSSCKPYKLSLFDQLTPMTYPSLLLFYPNFIINMNVPQTLTRLKNSLSQALALYYPLAGRIKNNLYVDDFDAGVPYLEARVPCRMLQFLKLQETELLNEFIPLHPFRKETDPTEQLPPIALQITLFACGGIALGFSAAHKTSDGETAGAFLKSWAAIFRGSHDQVINPNLSQSSSVFPPRDSLPENYLSLMDSLWFKESNYVTRRFVFDAKAICAIRTKAKSESVPKPTRVEAVTCFLWRHAMAASRALSGSPKTSIIAHAVNMRPRMKPAMSAESIGNLFWWATAAANPAETETQLCELVKLFDESLKGFDSDYLESLQGEEGFEAISDYFNQLEAMLSSESESPDIYAFTSWSNFFDQVDFGCGKPFWVGVMGKVGPAFRNLTVLVETQWGGKGIEAWVTLEDNQMALLEKDPEFLAFASTNPGISTL